MRNIIGLVISLVLAPNAFAASTGTLILAGTVAAVNDIVITAEGSNNSSLNITRGESAKKVASVAETSNDVLGYKIYMYSANAGELLHTSDAEQKTTYEISYDGGRYVSPPASRSPVEVKSVSSLSGLTTNTSEMLINVEANADAMAGTYTDTVTLSIVAN